MTRVLLTLFLLLTPCMAMRGQDQSKKYAISTQMFLDELQQQKLKQQGKHQAPAKRLLPDGSPVPEPERLIASPDTINGVVYISCFIHLNNPADLSAVRALGVEVHSTFDGLDFITANVPVNQLEALARIDNVTKIEVAELMHPDTEWARVLTNVDDLLTLSDSARVLGLTSQYDGSGVVLGITDVGIDFQHIAFKDKNGDSRIKRAYVYDGKSRHIYYTSDQIAALTTDNNTEDHGTHTSSTAGGSSVIVEKDKDTQKFTVTVTDDHSKASYGGMAPGVDLYLAGIRDLNNTDLMDAFADMVHYADSVGKPLVVSNSWSSEIGPHNGTGTWGDFIREYFGDTHPNHIALFSSGNNAGAAPAEEGGGMFIRKQGVSQAAPLYTIVRTRGRGGDYYSGNITSAYSDQPLKLTFRVYDLKTGDYVISGSCTENATYTLTYKDDQETTHTLYTGSLKFYFDEVNGSYHVRVYADNLISTTDDHNYTLALSLRPKEENVTANIHSWACRNHYYTDFKQGGSWTTGTDDMSTGDECTIPEVIAVGAYVSRHTWPCYDGTFPTANTILDDIAWFSSYATAEANPTRVQLPAIVGPGSYLVAGGNHFHTLEVDNDSYYNTEENGKFLVVNDANNLYVSMQGTSMSTPAVAGIVALWMQASLDKNAAHKNLTVNDVKDIMRRTAIQDVWTLRGPNASHFGQGKIDALEGIRYILGNGLSLGDQSYNDVKISRNADLNSTNIVLLDRTLYKDGDWNTLCLPFNVTDGDDTDGVTFTGTPLEGATVMTLSSSAYADGTLSLTFADATTIEAGKPYIIKWTKAAGYDEADPNTRDLKNPEFKGVKLSETSQPVHTNAVDFIGTYSPVVWEQDNRGILLVGGKNLYYPKPDLTDPGNPKNPHVNACRAFFQLNGLSVGDIHTTRMAYDVDGVTGIDEAAANSQLSTLRSASPLGSSKNSQFSAWYTLAGRRLAGKPTQKGIYIHQGTKTIIK